MVLKKVLNIFDKNQSKKFYICGFLNFIFAILELIGLLSLSVIVLLIISPDTYLEKLNNFDLIFFEQAVDQMRNLNFVLYFSGLMFAITTMIKLLIKQYTIKFTINLSVETSNLLFSKYINKKYIHLFEFTSAKLLNLANFHSARFANSVVSSLLNLINSFSIIVILLISLIYVGGLKTIVSLLLVTSVCVLIYAFIRKKIQLNEKIIINSDIERQNILNESYNNIKYLKLSKKYTRLINLFSLFGKNYAKSLSSNQIFLHWAKPLLEICFLIIATIFITITIDSKNVNIVDHIPIIAFFLLSFYRMIPSIQIIFQAIVHIKGSLETINIIEKEINKTEHQEKKIDNENIIKINFNEKIEISSVTFNYQKGKKLFERISLEIKKNSCVAFFGKSGQGKTTIIDLISNLIEPNEGKLLVDGIEICEQSRYSYQSKIGYLSQNFYIINESLINNVILQDENNSENRNKAKLLLNKLFDDLEIKNLIENEKKVGENGVKLSHGQKQRLLLVRLLYENKEILILDEPTSSLDEKNIIKLKEILKDLKKNKTIIITSHNKNMLEICDNAFLVDNNKIEITPIKK